MKYSEKLKDPRWQKKRLEIFERDKWTCQICGDIDKTLHVHHIKYIYGKNPWDVPDYYLLTLCEECHEEEPSRWDEAADSIIKVFKNYSFTSLDLLIFLEDSSTILYKYGKNQSMSGLREMGKIARRDTA